MSSGVEIQGELRLSAASLSLIVEASDGPVDLRVAATDPRDRFVSILGGFGVDVRFDGVRVALSSTDRTAWNVELDRVVAAALHHAESGQLRVRAEDAEPVDLAAGRDLKPVLSSWESTGGHLRAQRLGTIPSWVAESSAVVGRQFSLIGARSVDPELPAGFREVTAGPSGSVVGFVGAIDGRELFVAWRELSQHDAVSDGVRAMLRRTIAAEASGADELVSALERAVLYAGVVLADDLALDDERLDFLAVLANRLDAEVMDDHGVLMRRK